MTISNHMASLIPRLQLGKLTGWPTWLFSLSNSRIDFPSWRTPTRASRHALQNIGVGASDAGWTFPEFDGLGRIVGITVRHDNQGDKRAVRGSTRGLTLPACVRSTGRVMPQAPVYRRGRDPHSPRSSVNLLAIGRPMAMPTAAVRTFLSDLLIRHPTSPAGT